MASSTVSLCTDKLYKVLVIGEVGVGKSSIVARYVHRRFTDTYKASIGVDFALKTIDWSRETVVRLQLWDIAGQERCKRMSRVFYKEAMGALVVFDITDSPTLGAASAWKQDLDNKVRLDSGEPIPAVLMGNKHDKTDGTGDPASSLDRFCEDNGFLGWFQTSAKEDINIDEACAFLVARMLECDRGPPGRESLGDGIRVKEGSGDKPSQPACC